MGYGDGQFPPERDGDWAIGRAPKALPPLLIGGHFAYAVLSGQFSTGPDRRPAVTQPISSSVDQSGFRSCDQPRIPRKLIAAAPVRDD
ncbi:hypothetical protein ACFL5O_10225 [Myxococcota bacterium]